MLNGTMERPSNAADATRIGSTTTMILSEKALETLLQAAVWAPSGDNTQPWRFRVDRAAGRIDILQSAGDDPSAMNAGQHMSRMAVGAAVENVLRQARTIGLLAELVPPAPGAEASIRFRGDSPRLEAMRDPVLFARATNRRRYDGKPVPSRILDELRDATPVLKGVATRWIVDPGRISSLARVVGHADALFFESRARLRELVASVRFDLPPEAAVPTGLSVASLEMSGLDRTLLRHLPPVHPLVLRAAGTYRFAAFRTGRLVRSASGLCLGVATSNDAATDLSAGRAMQRAWLALTAAGLACQPMMALVGFQNALEPSVADEPGIRKRLPALGDEFRAAAPEIGAGHACFLMRFGYATPPSGRSGRRPLADVLVSDAAGFSR